MSIESLTAVGPVPGQDVSATAARAPVSEIVDLSAVPAAAWADLANRAIEPNAFFHPAWAGAVNAHASGKTGARVLLAWDGRARARLIGLLPVVSAWRALTLPIPVLVAWEAYAPACVPLLDRDRPEEAASGLLAAAAQAGAHALLLPFLTDGAAAAALHRAAPQDAPPRAMRMHRRARLDATGDPEAMLRDGLGPKKLKELRRQRNRLADDGEVTFSAATGPEAVAHALDGFLKLEDSGWKGSRGTALARDAGDAAFIRSAMTGLAAQGAAEVVTLARGGEPVAAGLVLRQGRRAYFFKIAYDESAAKMSPGVQLTLDLTRRLCADPSVDDADSIAVADHPMIDHIWRERLTVADLVVPTQPGAPAFRLCAALIAARHAAREAARRAVHAIRSR